MLETCGPVELIMVGLCLAVPVAIVALVVLAVRAVVRYSARQHARAERQQQQDDATMEGGVD